MLLLVPGEFPFYRYIIIRKTYPQRERSLSLAKWTQIIFLPLLLSYCMWSASWVYFGACVCYLPVFVYCLACAPLATCTENKRNVQTTNHVIKDPSHRKWRNKQQKRCTRAIKSNENRMKLVHSTHSEYRAVQTEPTQQWPRTLGHHINKAVCVVFFVPSLSLSAWRCFYSVICVVKMNSRFAPGHCYFGNGQHDRAMINTIGTGQE